MTEELLERDLQAKCVSWWASSGLTGLMFHPPNEGKRGRLDAAALASLGVVAGVPDLILLLPMGKVHMVELKAVSGQQSERQRRFEAQVAELGHTYSVVRSVDEFKRDVYAAIRYWRQRSVVEIPHAVALP